MFHPVYLLLAKSSPPVELVGGERWAQLPLCCWAGCPEQACGARGAGSLGSASSWGHQLGLALRSRWDIEIPDCP